MPEQPPTVTVVVACYRQAALVPGCLAGVAAQTRPADRVVLLDDASGDDSPQVLRASARELFGADCFETGRVRLLDEGPNVGLAARLDQALAVLRTDWFLVLAADDELVPRSLEVLTASAAAHPGCAAHFGDLEVMAADGTPAGYRRPAQTWQGAVARRYLTPALPHRDLLRWNNFVPGGMTLVSTAATRAAGGFRAAVRTTEDFDLWLRLGREHPFRYTGTTVGRYRVVPTSKSRDEPVSVLDHASVVGRAAAGGPPAARRDAARLVALRWSLAV
ncbi:glycosyltransferase family 2 protein, partial [Kineococcus glutinatus]|uniref:glycosyltransferase family 2 protein n=1 Tax=Kineococcus glutinatus TaxID=1070872 RepID=UPI0031E60598